MITQADSHISRPRITGANFYNELALAQSPARYAALGVYDYAVASGLDPLFLLAMFKHESNFGKEGTAAQTRSWGNTRLPIVGPTQPTGSMVEGRSGYFPVWRDWLAGGKSTIDRLVSRSYPPAGPYGLRSIGQVFNHPSGAVWAPAGDLNNPAGYLRSVLDYMNVHMNITEPQMQLTGFAEQDKIITGSNRPRTKLRGFHAVVIHETDNENAGAGAQNTYDWLTGRFNGGVVPPASFHFVTDGATSIQLLPIDELAWHIGDGADEADDEAFYTVGIETCVNSRAGYPSALARTARITARVLRAYGKTPIKDVTVRQHGSYWSTRNPDVHRGCPKHLKAADWGVSWDAFFLMVVKEFAAVSGKTPIAEPQPRQDGAMSPVRVTFENPKEGGFGIPVNIKVTVYNPENKQFYVGEWDNGEYKNWVML